MNRKRRFWQKLTEDFIPNWALCSADGDGAGTGDGGAGGGGGSDGGGGGSGSPASAASSDSDAGHSFSRSAAPDPGEVRTVLAREADPEHKLSFAEIRTLMGFEPKMGPKAPAPAPAAPAPAAPAASATGTEAPKTGTQAAPAPAVDPNVSALVQAIATAAKKSPAAEPSQPDPAPAPAPKEFYGGHQPAVQVSPDVAAALFNGEDPAKSQAALNHIVNGIMNKVMTDASQLMVFMNQQLQQQVLAQIPQVVTQQHSSKSNTEKFFGRYPELNKPGLQQLINNTAMQLREAKAKSDPTFDPGADGFLDEVGAAVHKAVLDSLGVAIPRSQQQQQQQPIQAPVPKSAAPKPFFTPGGSRPPANPHLNGQSADIMNTLF